MSEEEINEALDDLEKDHDAENIDEQQVNDDEQQIDAKQDDDQEKEKPPGYKTYDEWIADGRDPAAFRGEKAYTDHYETLKEVRELKSTMTHVVDGMETWKQQQNEIKAGEIEAAKAQAVIDLAKAKEDDDLDAALLAQGKITTLEQQRNIAPVVNPLISDFAHKNPIIDKGSTQYDAEFHQDMIMIHNSKLDQLLGGDRSGAGELSQAQIERVQAMAFNQAKELHKDKFVSPRNTRTTTATSTQRNNKPAPNTKARLAEIDGNPRNTRDQSPGRDMYEHLLAIDKDAAETFAKNVLGE